MAHISTELRELADWFEGALSMVAPADYEICKAKINKLRAMADKCEDKVVAEPAVIADPAYRGLGEYIIMLTCFAEGKGASIDDAIADLQRKLDREPVEAE